MSIAIMVFLFMVGVGSYWRMTRGYALRAGVSTLESTLHAARALAVHERSPADLMVIERQVDPPPAPPQVERIYVVGKRTVSCWHFEAPQFSYPKLLGALGQEGSVKGATDPKYAPVPGRIGSALPLDGLTHVEVNKTPYLDGIRDGVFVEAFVWPKPAGQTNGARLVIASQTAFSLALLCTKPTVGPPVFSLKGTVTTVSQTLSAQTYAIIPAGEWTHLALAYADAGIDPRNPSGIVLQVNGAEVELDPSKTETGTGPLAPNTGQLYIGGDPNDRFLGYLDELKIAALVKGEIQTLPKNTVVTRFGATALAKQGDVATPPAVAVRFDDEGKLDVTGTTAKARFYVDSPGDNLFRVVQVGRLGRIEVLSKLNKDSLDREVQ